MNLISRRNQIMGAIAVAAAVILTPTAVLAATQYRAGSAAISAPACATSDLRVWLGIPGDGALGSVYYQLEFSNISSRTCTLFGFPGVSAVGPDGGQLGSAASRDHGDPTQLVTLSPLATAHVVLRITNVGAFPPATCQPSNAIGLNVYPANTTTAATVPFSFQACAKSGPVFLTVRTTVAGTGIPAFST